LGTPDPRGRLRADAVRAIVDEVCFTPATGGDRVGLEAEVLPIARRGATTRRLRLREVQAVVAAVARRGTAVEPAVPSADGSVSHGLREAGAVTFEPGGQLEVSGSVRPTAAAALDDLERSLGELAAGFAAEEAVLASVGVDVWHGAPEVPQQLTAARYPAMATYLASRGPWGAVMMRLTASLQVNLDLGAGATAAERWEVANLAAPVATTTFACSPDPTDARVASRRAVAWQALDPTRTGAPAAFVAGDDDRVAVLVDAALAADVLLVRAGERAVPGRRGWTFGEWLRDGDPEHGWPTEDDLRYHLTTLFHDVRPRGPVELRTVDALPARWRAVPVVLTTGLLYDGTARRRVLDVLRPHRRDLPALARRAAREGLADPAVCALAVEVWSYALEGARRLPEGSMRPGDLDTAAAYLDRFTTRGRAPADELRAVLAEDPVAALRWAAEPVPEAVLTW
jgi:glutamate--cysteine ligase